MLRTPGSWEKLSDKERLVIMSVASELPYIRGNEVMYHDALKNSGLTLEVFRSVVCELKSKGLISCFQYRNMSCDWLKLEGDATSLRLVRLSHIHK